MEQVRSDGSVVSTVHFVSEVPTSSGVQWRIACMPNMTEFHATPYHPNYPRTNEVRAVSCPACEKSAVFQRAKDAQEEALDQASVKSAMNVK